MPRWLFKVNINGVCSLERMVTGCIRTQNGDVDIGLSFTIGYGSSLHAKLWAILMGLPIAWDARMGKLW